MEEHRKITGNNRRRNRAKTGLNKDGAGNRNSAGRMLGFVLPDRASRILGFVLPNEGGARHSASRRKAVEVGLRS
jgi:hypothetical protein